MCHALFKVMGDLTFYLKWRQRRSGWERGQMGSEGGTRGEREGETVVDIKVVEKMLIKMYCIM